MVNSNSVSRDGPTVPKRSTPAASRKPASANPDPLRLLSALVALREASAHAIDAHARAVARSQIPTVNAAATARMQLTTALLS